MRCAHMLSKRGECISTHRRARRRANARAGSGGGGGINARSAAALSKSGGGGVRAHVVGLTIVDSRLNRSKKFVVPSTMVEF